MRFERRRSVAGVPIRDQVTWKLVDAVIRNGDGSVRFEQRGVEVPEAWSTDAVNVLAQKYFRKAGVADAVYEQIDGHEAFPSWLRPSSYNPVDVTFGAETSAHAVFHRMAGAWTYWGWRGGYFDDEESASAFFDECYMSLAMQTAAPNSPQWFNTGLFWAYGISGPASGQWAVDADGEPYETDNSYERPQPHACFIQPVTDDLVNPGGMMDLWTREARLFKQGSGSGSNMSAIRAKGEKLSGGGVSSGLISFLEVGDRSAGSIQSGGTTRRAALMRCLDLDHPEVLDFIWWKVREEAKSAAISVGSRTAYELLSAVADANGEDDYSIDAARNAGIPEAMIDRARVGIVPESHAVGWEGEATRTVSGQNSNNSVRVTDKFMRKLDDPLDYTWHLTARTTGDSVKQVTAPGLWDQICRATWAGGDPGIQFDTTINEWHTCPNDGRINASNPCSEYMFLDDTACNLASLKLTAYLRDDSSLDLEAYEHDVRLWTVILDVSIGMASFPSREIAVNTWKYRTLGLGYMDLGGLLMRLALPYDSDEGRALAAGLTALMTGVAYRTSADMADELGAFPRWEANAEPMARVLRNHARAAGLVIFSPYEGLSISPIEYIAEYVPTNLQQRIEAAWESVNSDHQGFRNAQVTLLAPTGTISFVTDCDTTGIEPDFSLVKHKQLAGGGTMKLVNRAVGAALRHMEVPEEVVAAAEVYVAETGALDGFPIDLTEAERAVFDCSVPTHVGGRYLEYLSHVRMVAAVQPFLSGAVSKTINLPRHATVADVDRVYREAHRLGLKAVAPYRDGCKLSQPLNVTGSLIKVVELNAGTPLPRGVREYLPWRREGGVTQKVKIGEQSVFLTINPYPDGRPGEFYLILSHEGSTMRAMAELVAMMGSLALQYGAPAAELVDRLVGTRFEPAGFVEGHDRIKVASSIGDFVGRELGITYCGFDDLGQVSPASPIEALRTETVALDKRAVGVALGYTGDVCPECGNATMQRAGACLVCATCKATTGCG